MIRLSVLFVIGVGFLLWIDHSFIRAHVLAQSVPQVQVDNNPPPVAANKAGDKAASLSDQSQKVGLTTLGLRLVGVISSHNDLQAIIAIGDVQATYSKHAILPLSGKVTVDEIQPDHVILNNNGHIESLGFDSTKASPAQEVVEPADAPKEVPVFYGRTLGPGEPPPYAPDEQQEKAALADVGHKFASLMTLNIQRGDNTHQLLGYKISATNGAEKLQALGLQNDDMITAINGIPITKPEEILQSYDKRGDGLTSLEIERGDRVINVELANVVP